jgi:acyl-CoA synthetase (AMP-forming)/AMP-acid ligase II
LCPTYECASTIAGKYTANALSSTKHIYGLVVLAHMPVLNGCTTIICPKFDLEAFCATVQQYKVTVAFLVPPIILRLVGLLNFECGNTV